MGGDGRDLILALAHSGEHERAADLASQFELRSVDKEQAREPRALLHNAQQQPPLTPNGFTNTSKGLSVLWSLLWQTDIEALPRVRTRP